MVAILKQGADKKKMQELLDDLYKNRMGEGINVRKYCETIKLKEDALAIQKKLKVEGLSSY